MDALVRLMAQIQASAAPVAVAVSRKRRPRREPSFGSAVLKVLKCIHPGLSISTKAMAICCSLLSDSFSRLIVEVKLLHRMRKMATLTSREAMYAVRLVFVGETAKYAVAEGCKATTKFLSSSPGSRDARVSRSVRGGLHLPTGRIERDIRELCVGVRIQASMPIFITAALEYIIAEVLELSGNVCLLIKSKRILPRHICMAIRNDNELNRLFPGAFQGGGLGYPESA